MEGGTIPFFFIGGTFNFPYVRTRWDGLSLGPFTGNIDSCVGVEVGWVVVSPVVLLSLLPA